MNPKEADTILWKGIRRGEIAAYQRLYDRYADLLFSFAMQYTSDADMAKDAIHDVFLRLFNYRKNLAGDVAVKNYLLTAVQRDLFRKLRSSRNIDTLSEDNLAEEDIMSSEEEWIKDERVFEKQSRLAEALSGLTEKQRYALHLRFYEDRSYEEIAGILGISVESSRTLIYRSLREMRKKL